MRQFARTRIRGRGPGGPPTGRPNLRGHSNRSSILLHLDILNQNRNTLNRHYQTFLSRTWQHYCNITVCTDEGGKLWASALFHDVLLNTGYLLEPTAVGAPFQNGLAEQHNPTLATMVHCLHHSANPGPQFWSYALIHAVYLKNRLPHSPLKPHPIKPTLDAAPQPNTLGCPIITENPGKHPAKWFMHTSAGIFLGYTATDKNIYI